MENHHIPGQVLQWFATLSESNPLKLHRPPVPLQTWKPRHVADSVSVQYIAQHKASKRKQSWCSEHIVIPSKLSLEKKTCFLPTSQIYKAVYYPTQMLLFKPVLASERRSDFAKRLLRTLKLNFSSYLKTSPDETLFQGNHKRRKQQLQCRMFVHIEGMWWYHFGMCFLSQVFVLVVGMSLS